MQVSNILKSLVTTTVNIVNLKKRKLQPVKYQTGNNNAIPGVNKQKYNSNKRKVGVAGMFSDLTGFVSKIAASLAALGLVNWLSDSKNKGAIEGILKFGKGLFDAASKVAEFGVDALLSGLAQMTSGSILERMFGILKALTGFLALKWLISPMKIFGDIKGFIKFIKNIPANIQKLSNFAKGVVSTVGNLLKWSAGLAKGIATGLAGVFSKAIIKVFGQSTWNLFKAAVQKSVGAVGGGVGKLVGGAGKLLGNASKGVAGFTSKYISKAFVRTAGKFLSKIPIVGSLIGFGINIALGDPVEKAAFKLGSAAVGSAIGGVLGGFFPPALPFTVPIGGLFGDFIGDKLFDFFVPPKLALGGIVSHQSTEGTHVIVAEKEDEVVIPLSMLTMDNFAGSSFYDSIKTIGSSILGAVQSVLSSMGLVGNSISSSISQFISPLIKLFGVSQYNSTDISVVSSNTSSIQTNSKNIINNNSLTDINILDSILGIAQLSTVSASNNLESISDLSIRGLLRGILDVVANGNLGTSSGGIFNQMISTVQNVGQIIQSSVQTAFNNVQGVMTGNISGNAIATGRATVYAPSDVPGDKWANTTSSGEPYSHTAFTAAAFPELLDKLPKEYTISVGRGDGVYRGKRTVRKPFNIYVKDSTTGRSAIIRVNNVGNGNGTGNDGRILDFTTASARYFGGGKVSAADKFGYQVFIAPPNATPGPISNTTLKKKYSEGGEYVYKSTKPHAYGAPRRNRTHAGHDIPISKDGTFQSFLGGSVVYKGYQPGKNKYGNYIDIYNEQKQVVERIAEIGDTRVNLGDTITPGQVVGTGTSTGVIHYEIRKMDKYARQYGYTGTTNPMNYLTDNKIITIADNKFKFNTVGTETNKIATNNPFTEVLLPKELDVSNLNLLSVQHAGDTNNVHLTVNDHSNIRRSRIQNLMITKM